MSEGYKIRSLSEIVNEILSTVRSYYDAEYAYYIEKDRGDIETIYEWCDENIEWQRDRMKLLPEERQPKWMKTEITDTTARDYSVFLPISEDVTAVLAVVGVRRGGCTIDLMRAIVQYIPQAIALQKMQKQQEYLSYHDDLTGLLNRNSFVGYLAEVKQEEPQQQMFTNKDDSAVKQPKKRAEEKIGRNDPCPCGSGKKYKQCCGRNA